MTRLILFRLSILAAFAAMSGVFFSLTGHAWTHYRYKYPEAVNHKSTSLANPLARIFSYDPLVVHIEDLVTPGECEYIKKLALPYLKRSAINLDGKTIETNQRTSSTAFMPLDDKVIQTIVRRANEFQGYIGHYRIDVQVTSYQEGQEYRPHFDWYRQGELHVNRFSTFFVTLEASCDDCGTQFPRIEVDWTKRDKSWCEFFNCSRNVLTTKSIKGSALFWRNLDDDLRGRQDTLHAGLPAKNGVKIGLNIWTEIETHGL